MTEWNCEVVIIEDVIKHPNADNLDIVKVNGDYPVVVVKDSYKVNDKAAYIAIDTIVPDTPEFYFLCPKEYEQYEENGIIKNRVVGPKYIQGQVPEKCRIIKAKKIRNVYSMGMLMPNPDFEVGQSVVEHFQLKKIEEENEENIEESKFTNSKKRKGGEQESPPKGWAIPYYDIDGFRKYYGLFLSNEEVVINEKLNGSNFSACFDGEKLYVKSRRFYKKHDESCMWWDLAIRYDLENKLKKYPMYVFFGEMVGQVTKFRYDAEIINNILQTKLYLFDIYDVNNHKYLDYDQFKQITTELDLPIAPELYVGVLPDKEALYTFAEGNTFLGGKHVREGIVIKSTKERFEPKLQGRMQLKLIGEGYSLKK